MADGNGPELHYREMLVREIREDAREADFVCSTEKKDTYETILRQDWDLSRFRTNPVVLYCHNSRDLKPIGQARNVRVEAGALIATVWFSQVTKDAEECWQLVREKTLRGISVGFDSKSVTYDSELDAVILAKNELYELSLTPLPSNPEALARMRARAIADTPKPQDPAPTAPIATKPPATVRGTETTMDELAIKALQDRAAEQDNKIRDLTASGATLIAERDTLAGKAKTFEDQNKVLAGERDAFKAKVDLLEGAAIEREVDALVGKKFTPSERDQQVKVAKLDIALWRELTAQRSDLSLMQQVIPAPKPEDAPAPVATGDRSTDEAAEAAEFFRAVK